MKIDGREAKAEHRAPLLGAIRSLGIHVPTLCHLDGLEPYGVCRMCVVEVKRGKRTRLVTSCNFPSEEGLEVFTDTERVRQHRKIMAELLLARCPNVPYVQELARSVGVEKSRFRMVEASDCVMCGLCVRVCDQIVGASALSFIDRGNQRVVGTPWYVDDGACIACGACSYVCPTGAMHMEEQTTERWRRELAADQRICRYARMGLVSYKICPNDFRCSECDVDQRLFEEHGTHPVLAVAPGQRSKPRPVGPFLVVEDRCYSRSHAWVKMTGGHARIGIDDFALQLLGPVEQVTVHSRKDAAVKTGDAAVTVVARGRRMTLRFPVAGTVAGLNETVLADPAMLAQDCYDRGWILRIRPTDFYTQSRLLIGRDDVASWIAEQTQKLAQALGVEVARGLEPGFGAKIADKDFARLGALFLEDKPTPTMPTPMAPRTPPAPQTPPPPRTI
ncbi:MAG: (2Fe-2S)-binding protein [Deltaproteobacteria bacterium]|nr:(2Fe-2S)-binding protein [Deltaproteobacteria bacterium]